MPPNTSTPGSFEETIFMQNAYEKAIDDLIKPDPKLTEASIWHKQSKVHAAFTKLLGGSEKYNQVVGKAERVATPDVARRVVSYMLETNVGINDLIRDSVKKPEDAEITISSKKVKLSTLISDPKSEDARMLAWYFENVAMNAQKERAFDFIDASQVTLLRAILKARKVYDELIADPKNFNIGDSSTTSPVVGTQIGRLQQQYADVVADERAANAEISRLTSGPAAATVNISGYQEQLKAARTEKRDLKEKIANLDAKCDDVKAKMDEIIAVPGVTFTNRVDTVSLSKNLDKTTLATALGTSTSALTLAKAPHTLKEYLTDDDVRSWTDDLSSSLARVGTKQPTAAEALNRVMGSEFRGMIPDANRRVEFIKKMNAMMASASGPEASSDTAASVATAETHTDTKKTSLLGRGFKAMYDYMTEVGPSFIHVYTRPKDK